MEEAGYTREEARALVSELAPLREVERKAQIQKLPAGVRPAVRALLGFSWSPYVAAELEGYTREEVRSLVAELKQLEEVERKAQIQKLPALVGTTVGWLLEKSCSLIGNKNAVRPKLECIRTEGSAEQANL